MQYLNNQTIQLALIAIVTLVMLIQTIFVLAALVALRKLSRSIHEEIVDLRFSIMPIIENARDLFERLAPKIEATTEDLAALTRALRDQSADVQSAADEIIARARRQAGRIDTMLSSVLDAVDRAGVFMADTVSKPMRQISAFLASARAVVDSLRSSEAAARAGTNHGPGKNDPFV